MDSSSNTTDHLAIGDDLLMDFEYVLRVIALILGIILMTVTLVGLI